MTIDQVRETITGLRAGGGRVVLTNGVFDILHAGHVRYLQQARGLGDFLVVALNSDASTRALKGPGRPIMPERERQELLEALKTVDAVVLFDETTAARVIETLRPDVYVKGGDYQLDTLPEARIVERYGGQVRLLDFVEGHSTTDIVSVIKARFCP